MNNKEIPYQFIRYKSKLIELNSIQDMELDSYNNSIRFWIKNSGNSQVVFEFGNKQEYEEKVEEIINILKVKDIS